MSEYKPEDLEERANQEAGLHSAVLLIGSGVEAEDDGTNAAMLRAGAQAMRDLLASQNTAMETFTVYRRLDISATHTKDQVNPPDEPQFEGVVFSDGTVAIKWLTAVRSCAVFPSLDDLKKIHGHPEYGSEWVWHNKARAVLKVKP